MLSQWYRKTYCRQNSNSMLIKRMCIVVCAHLEKANVCKVWFSSVLFSSMWVCIDFFLPFSLDTPSASVRLRATNIHPPHESYSVLWNLYYTMQRKQHWKILLTLTHVQCMPFLPFIELNRTIELSVAEYYKRTKAEKLIYLFLSAVDLGTKTSQAIYIIESFHRLHAAYTPNCNLLSGFRERKSMSQFFLHFLAIFFIKTDLKQCQKNR